jgi:pyruvate dehydrogenase E1 component beta subunit
MVPRALEAAERLSGSGVHAEVIDVRTLVPLDMTTIAASIAKTSRLFTVEENPRLCGWGAEIASVIQEEIFGALKGPIVRITTPHVPLPAADQLEDAVVPSVARIAAEIRRALESRRAA